MQTSTVSRSTAGGSAHATSTVLGPQRLGPAQRRPHDRESRRSPRCRRPCRSSRPRGSRSAAMPALTSSSAPSAGLTSAGYPPAMMPTTISGRRAERRRAFGRHRARRAGRWCRRRRRPAGRRRGTTASTSSIARAISSRAPCDERRESSRLPPRSDPRSRAARRHRCAASRDCAARSVGWVIVLLSGGKLRPRRNRRRLARNRWSIAALLPACHGVPAPSPPAPFRPRGPRLRTARVDGARGMVVRGARSRARWDATSSARAATRWTRPSPSASRSPWSIPKRATSAAAASCWSEPGARRRLRARLPRDGSGGGHPRHVPRCDWPAHRPERDRAAGRRGFRARWRDSPRRTRDSAGCRGATLIAARGGAGARRVRDRFVSLGLHRERHDAAARVSRLRRLSSFPEGARRSRAPRWCSPTSAATLERIRDSGAAGFYRGRTADLIVAEMQRGGGIIIRARPRGVPTACGASRSGSSYRGHTIYSMAPVSSGRRDPRAAAQHHGGLDRGLRFGSAELLHREAEAMRRAFTERNRRLGDPAFVSIPLPMLLSKQFADSLRAGIDLDAGHADAGVRPRDPGPGEHHALLDRGRRRQWR